MTLRELRKQSSLTLEDLSILAGVDIATLSKGERGYCQFTPEKKRRLAEVLGVYEDDILWLSWPVPKEVKQCAAC